MKGAWHAKRKKDTAEQIVGLLRQIEVEMANGKMTPQACKEAGITEQTYYRWRKEYGGLQVDQARTMWSLSNAFTSAFKELEPIPQYKATAKLAGFLQSVRPQ